MSNKPRHRKPRRFDRRPSFSIYAIDTGECSATECNCISNGRPWSYTVGRSRRGRAELVTTGLLSLEVIHGVTNLVAHEIDEHQLLEALGADRTFALHDFRFRLDVVPPEWVLNDPTRIAGWYTRFAPRALIDPPEILQIVWSDKCGLFPDNPLCGRLERQRQVLLAEDQLNYPSLPDELGLTG